MARPKLNPEAKLVLIHLRVTPRQKLLMDALSTYDGLPIQEHVRRAMDIYLNAMRAKIDTVMAEQAATPEKEQA